MQDFSGEIAALRKRLGDAETYLKIGELRERRPELEDASARPDLWDDPDEARKVTGELAAVVDDLTMFDRLAESIDEAETLADQSGYAFNITDDVDERLLMAPLGIFGFAIPPGEDEYTHSDSYVLPVGLTVHSVFPHMHQMGRSYEVTVNDECLIRGDYDFDNQLPYTFRDPVKVEPDSRITVSCTWMNDTDETVRYGERTDEEMCFAFAMLSLGG